MQAAEPVINPRLFENSIFTVSAAAAALRSAAMFGAIMFLPLFVQGVLGKSATNSGISLSLSTAISDLFLISAVVGLAGLVVVLFLREDPLRRTHALDPDSGEEDSEAGPGVGAGVELGIEPGLGIGAELKPEAETVV
jgi:hypothetical protein